MLIIIDGYNFIGAVRNLNPGLENLRENLITELSSYARTSDNKVMVVFDGDPVGFPYIQEKFIEGIDIVFSPYDQKADEIIINICKKNPYSIVVTNDSDIRKTVENYNCIAIFCEEFEKKMKDAKETDYRKDFDEKENEYSWNLTTEKKGNPHKLSKKERKKKKGLSNL